MEWVEGELCLNVDPRRDITTHPGYGGGRVLVEVRDERGDALPGFSFEKCVPVAHNSARTRGADATSPVTWKSEKKMSALAGRRIALAFRLRDAHLYSFKAK
jgi:hypothetical protein